MLLKIHNDCSVYKAPNEMNNELIMILEEAVVACFKTISWHFAFERLRDQETLHPDNRKY
jgi:hypothetical protein